MSDEHIVGRVFWEERRARTSIAGQGQWQLSGSPSPVDEQRLQLCLTRALDTAWEAGSVVTRARRPAQRCCTV